MVSGFDHTSMVVGTRFALTNELTSLHQSPGLIRRNLKVGADKEP